MRNVVWNYSYLPHEVRHHITIEKFRKGGFNLRSPNTQYLAILDVSILINHLQNKNADGDTNSS